MLAGDAGERIADHPPEIGLQLGVAARDLGEEGEPGRAVAARRGGGDLGHAEGAVVRGEHAAAQIHDAGRGVQQPGIAVPHLGGGGVAAIGARQALDGGDRRGLRELRADLGVVRAVGGGAADVAGQVEGAQGALALPAASGPGEPGAPDRDVAPVLAMARAELGRQRILGEADR